MNYVLIIIHNENIQIITRNINNNYRNDKNT